MRRRQPRGCGSLTLAAMLALGVLGCQSTTTAAGDGGAGSGLQLFVAQRSDFAGFGGWTSHTIVAPAPDGSPHTTGMRTVYLNHVPAHGSTLFAVGTILVKTVHSSPGDMTLDQTFAMAKRGGNYDFSGALGWEWFELDITVDPPDIVWRGIAPPMGVNYTASAAGCSECHAAARANDFVQDSGFQLADF